MYRYQVELREAGEKSWRNGSSKSNSDDREVAVTKLKERSVTVGKDLWEYRLTDNGTPIMEVSNFGTIVVDLVATGEARPSRRFRG